MSSGGWEKVGSGKPGKGAGGAGKAKGGGKANGRAGGQQQAGRAQQAMPKLEDVLPMEQISRLQALMPEDDGGDAGRNKQPSPAAAKNKAKGQQGGQAGKKEESKKGGGGGGKDQAAKLPKTVDEAAKKVDTGDLQRLLAQVKLQYPGNGLLWVKDAVSYLNLALNAEELVDLTNPFSNRPLSLLTKETKKVLTALYEDCGDQAREGAFDNVLANMAHDMAKNLCPHGSLAVLQHLAEVYPSLCINNPTRFRELIRSYQNRPTVATALMWALGQGGRKDLAVGLKAWTEFIADLLPLKHYSKFVVDYLGGLLEHHSDRVRKLSGDSKGSGRMLYSLQFFKIFDVIFNTSAYPNLNKQFKARLLELYPVIKALSVGDCRNDHELFPEFLRRLGAHKTREASGGDVDNPVETALKEECLHSLTQCLLNNPASVQYWKQMYTSHLAASAELLSHLDANWKGCSSLSKNSELLRTLEAFDEHNDGVVTQKDGLALASTAAKSLLTKMRRGDGSSGGGGWFPWKTMILLLAILIYALVAQDIQKHGTFEKSKTGIFLKDVGMDQYALRSYKYWTTKASDLRDWGERTAPVVAKKAAELNTAAQPYVKQARQQLWKAYQWCGQTTWWAVQKIEEMLPGAQEKLLMVYEEAVKLAVWLWEGFVYFTLVAVKVISEASLAAWKSAQDAFDRIAKSDDKLNETMVVAKTFYSWGSAKAADAVKWVSSQTAGKAQ